jgi:hypothetical protein
MQATDDLTLEGALQLAGDITTLRVVTRAWQVSSFVQETTGEEGGAASDAPVENTAGEEEFSRFCAFANDRRVTAKRGLLPGTYATTAADAAHVATGTQAVSRYALPIPRQRSIVSLSSHRQAPICSVESPSRPMDNPAGVWKSSSPRAYRITQ